MQTQSKEAHIRRSAILTEKLGFAPERSRDLDAAVEFGVFEGKSIADAMREFGYSLQVIGSTALNLPVMPKAARRLRRMPEQISQTELAEIAGSDPVLTARLLVSGTADARKSLLAACFPSVSASKTLGFVWDHSQSVASAAYHLAVLAGINPENAWTAGLLHDIGRIAFATMPARRRAAEQDWLAAGFPLTYAETLAYGQDHARFGAGVLRQWGLPDEIVEAVALHHRPECRGSQLSAILCLAEDLSEDLWPEMRRMIALEKAGISTDQLSLRAGELTIAS